MTEQSNAPMSPEPSASSGVEGWVSTWIAAITKPNEQTYAAMAEHPDARTINRAFIWVFIAGTVSALISGLLTAVIQMAGFAAPSPFDQFSGGASQSGIATLGTAICTSPISGLISLLAFAVFTGVYQWVAKLFKGIGSYSQLAYVLAAITVPFNLIFAFIAPLYSARYVGACFGILALVALLYVVYLEVAAVKGVNKFGWGEAAGSILLPTFVLMCCVAIAVFGVMSALLPAINQSIP